MQFSKIYFELRSHFNPEAERTTFPGSRVECHGFQFNSTFVIGTPKGTTQETIKNRIFAIPDEAIKENQSFRYYVFTPGTAAKYRKSIILLHGLNERSWLKYLAWAYYLAEQTGSPVILFPIAFHMNRSPEDWGNPRLMNPILALRKQKYGEDPLSTFANVALSERLTEDPLRFFTSGQQSAADLVRLTRQIKRGEHRLFEKSAAVNVFAYSIGAFLAQILFLANPYGLFTRSKLFLFCGGGFFNQMNGISKLIMDHLAFKRLQNFYIRELSQGIDEMIPLANLMGKTKLGQAFLAMLGPDLMQNFRQEKFRQIRNRIQAVALSNDQVIPAHTIFNVLGEDSDIEILDFPFRYCHETPFPLNNSLQFPLVDEGFEKVFSKAARFLA